ncbi:MAG: hotdog domain-containing protein [Candidatus Dormiibacterota bacterium]
MSDRKPLDALAVTHRRYVPYGHAHYGGGLVDGAYVLRLFGYVLTEASIRLDGDEGLIASYSEVQFKASVRAGDVVEARATLTRIGNRSRSYALEAWVACRANPDGGPSAAVVVEPPLTVAIAVATVVVPAS